MNNLYIKSAYLSISILILLIIASSCNKSEDSKACNENNIETSFSITKLNVKCSDIDFNWELDFGVSLRIKAEALCDETCNEKVFSYSYRLIRKSSLVIDTLEGANRATFFGRCNDEGFRKTLNTPAGEPQEYNVGDTIQYEIYQIGICSAQDTESELTSLCNLNEIEILDLPFLYDIYILTEEDFECE